MTRRRVLATVLSLTVAALVIVAIIWREPLAYLLRQATFQGELLYGRIPLEEAIQSGQFDEKQIAKLRLVPAIKSYGKDIGLSATQNYDTINPTWNHTIWNVSASQPLAFKNKKWWFPIVGPMPYLGFFERDQADALADELKAEDLDVYVRSAGAYSTLGWFEDPLMPKMLEWKEYSLANTILHELAHATIWIPGSVQFNESFANFVGDTASRRYMLDKYGADSPEVKAMMNRIQDGEDWRTFMHGVYKSLDRIYTDEALDDEAKRKLKAAVLSSLESRIDTVGFRNPERYKTYVRKGDWNNARLMQFRTYNRSRGWFRKLYEQNDEDLLKFMHATAEVTANADNPYKALAEAVGETYDPKAK